MNQQLAVRLAHRGQGGFVLGVVLAAMVVGLLLITALLSLSFATHRAAIAQQENAREQRAADGALETSLTRVRASYNDPSATELCEPFEGATPELDQIDFDSGTTETGDDVTVRVECGHVLGKGGAARGTLQLVGSDYSAAPGGLDWVGWDWAAALGSHPDSPGAALAPTLVHNADEPLLFNGSVAARSGAAALLGAPGESGAIDIEGNYVQGAPGFSGTGTQCGMLDLANTTLPGDSDPSRTAVVDSDALPECGNSDAAALEASPVLDGPTDTAPGPVPATCPGTGGVVTFSPGDYTALATAALNSLFDGSCPNVFHFLPGDYWFDAGGPDNALVFDDAASAFVFGTRVGADETATCDPTAADGVAIVLSGRTSVEHLAGNVSICADGGEGSALAQSEVVESSITMDNATTGRHRHYCGQWIFTFCNWWVLQDDFIPVSGVLEPADGSVDAVATANCYFNVAAPAPCALQFSVDLHADGNTPMDNVAVAWTSSETPPVHVSNRTVNVTIQRSGANPINCAVSNVPAGRTPAFITAVDLTGCPDLAGQPESVLDGATMTVRFVYPDYNPPPGFEHTKLHLRGLHMRVNAAEIPATAADSPSTAWPGADPSVLTAGGGWATFPEPGTETPQCEQPFAVLAPVCHRTDDSETEARPLTLSGFDIGPGGFDPDDRISSLLLAVTNHGGENGVSAPITAGVVTGKTRVSVTWNGGANTCDVAAQTINTYTRSARQYFIDILAGESSSCDVLEGQPMSILEDATVTFSISPERGGWVGSTPNPDLGMALPELDHLSLVATTDTVDEVRRSVVTNEVDNNTRFRVHGDVNMPRTSLDVRWNGQVDSDPIVVGSMQLDSLGSIADADGHVGIVCCGTGARQAFVVAEIQDEGGDWVTRGVARATLTKNPAEPLADSTITGWQLCGGSTECVVPSEDSVLPPP